MPAPNKPRPPNKPDKLDKPDRPGKPDKPGKPGGRKKHKTHSLMQKDAKQYGFVSTKNGYTAYRCKTDPLDEIILDINGDLVGTDIITFWSTL